MALSLASLKSTSALSPPRILAHGVAGIRKSTFGTKSDRPVFVQTEDGLGNIKVAHFPLAKSFDDVMEALAALYSEPHDYKTVVVDSVDWLEPLVWQRACKDNGWSSIEEPGYGKGYVAALDLWRQYLDGLNALRDEGGGGRAPGDLVLANRMKTKDKGGRPAHAPADRSRQMVEVLSGFGIPQDKIADVIGVDGKTLRKHYATELQRGAATVEAKLVGNLLKLASGSDGTALKAIMFALQCRFGWSLYAPPPPEPKRPLGKKEQLQIEAETAHAGNSWGELLQ